ncbi:MAG: glycosyl transferase, family 2 [Parcubacteria group bacterium]|nr:glycosyl transferase, family 2 [Parcubacteria group bacterium]
MKESPSISIVIPLYNEAENIVPFWEEIKETLSTIPPAEVIFVDDGSTDGSAEILRKLIPTDPRLRAVVFSSNAGQTPAMGAGVDAATGKIVLFLDGDRQNDPHDIARLLSKLDEGYDVVAGWRRRRNDPFLRSFVSRIANRLVRATTGVALHDTGCSLKAFRAPFVKRIEFRGEIHRLLPVYALWQGARISEIEVNHRPRVAGVSKYGFSRIIKILLDLLLAQFTVRWRRRPMYFFGMLAAWALGLAFLILIWALILKFSFATSLIQTPLPLFSALLVILAMQMLSMGIVADLLMRTDTRKPYEIKESLGF